MSEPRPLIFFDRELGKLRQEIVYAHGFLDWSYNTRIGRCLTDWLFRRRWFSRLYGWSQRRRWSRCRIRPFVERFRIDLSEVIQPLERFESFADFFVREIDLSRRGIRREADVCVAPADGRALVYSRVDPEDRFPIKSSQFNLGELLADDDLAGHYRGGAMFVTRLYLPDYHHVHFPDAGIPGPTIEIDGGLYAVSPYSRQVDVPVYSRNVRTRSEFESEGFGRIAIVEIGAFTVGSIEQRYAPGERVERATRKAVFGLGGSTVVLVFEPGRIAFDDDLLVQSSRGIETYVRLGQSIGSRVASKS